MKDTAICATAARSEADRGVSGDSEAEGGPAVAGAADGVSSSEIACESTNGKASVGGLLTSAERNVNTWVNQSINGFCQYNP